MLECHRLHLTHRLPEKSRTGESRICITCRGVRRHSGDIGRKDFNTKFHTIVLFSKEFPESNWVEQKTYIYERRIQIYAVGSSPWYVWLLWRHARTSDFHPNPPAEIEFLFSPSTDYAIPPISPRIHLEGYRQLTQKCYKVLFVRKNGTNLFLAAFR